MHHVHKHDPKVFDPTESAGTIADYFTANPDTNAIFMLGPNPSSALNLYVQEAGLEPGELYATTHDTSNEIFDMIVAPLPSGAKLTALHR